MGADAKGKKELPTDLLIRSSLFCDLPEQSVTIGEFQHIPKDQAIPIVPIGIALRGSRSEATLKFLKRHDRRNGIKCQRRILWDEISYISCFRLTTSRRHRWAI